MRKEPEYRIEKGQFAFYWDEHDVRFRCESVAIVGQYDLGGGEGAFLRQHGPAEQVREWFKKEREKFLEKGNQEWADKIFLIESDKWDIDELNRRIQITSYVGVMLKKTEEPQPELLPVPKKPVDELLEGFDEG